MTRPAPASTRSSTASTAARTPLYTTPVAFNTPGTYDVDYKATDKIGNVSTVKTISFKLLSGAGCTSARSDEFNGTALGAQWQRHTRNGGSPASAFTFSGGQLHMPTADFELDAAAATTSVGPVNFIGQDLAALGTNWTAETEFTVKYTGGWQNTGLIIYNGDNNFVRSSITHSLSGRQHLRRDVQGQPDDDRGRSLAGRQQHHDPARTRRSRSRSGCAWRAPTAPTPSRRSTASWPRRAWRWPTGPTSAARQTFVDLNPSSGRAVTRRARASASSRSPTSRARPAPSRTRARRAPWTSTTSGSPRTRCTCETDAPATTATLDPAAPATGDTYDTAVKVNLSALDTGTNAAGVEKTEYRITTNGTAGDWKTLNNSAGDSPFVNTVTVSNSGTHLVEFRSTDKAANTEATKSVTFKVQLPVCDRSDEFDGTDILPRWVRHTRNGGTPTTGPLAPTVSGGQLHLPTNDFEIDAADAHDLGRPDQLPRPGPARAGRRLDRGDAVHRPLQRAAGRTSAWWCGTETTTSSAPR